MTGDDLAAAFQALAAYQVGEDFFLTGTAATHVYIDKVPSSPSLPYVFVLTNFPTVAERALSRDVHSRHLRSRTTIVGESAASVRIIAQKLSNSLEGARPVVAGWVLGRVESVPNEQPIQPDTDVTIPGTTNNPLYQPFDWTLTGSTA